MGMRVVFTAEANDIPGDVSLAFRDLEVFFEARGSSGLRERLARLLKVAIAVPDLQHPALHA